MGRDRQPARHHPPSRPATLGRTAITTAATEPLTPGPEHGPGAGASADDTITWADFQTWERQLATSGTCTRPIRIRGRIDAIDLATGELAHVYDTGTEHGGVLHIACGNRRDTVCPACSQVYKRDARQLVRAGLAGGKGIPETVAAHPCVFATLTAPSFGPVHSRRMRGKTVLPCRPRRDEKQRRCPHGHDISCPVRHVEDEARLGRPICPDCYDYTSAVLFNAHAGELWRRFVTYLPRCLAKLAGVSAAQFRRDLRIRYVKVAEWQARGVVHFHAVIRLDAHTDDDTVYLAPPDRYTAALLADAIAQAAALVRVPIDSPAGRKVLRFGIQTDARPIWRENVASSGKPLDVAAVANYIAKYVTKAVDVPGLPDQRIRYGYQIAELRCSAHHKTMVRTAWDLGRAREHARYRHWAHMLGYGGHPMTKSRRYSVTFGELRQARAAHRHAERHPDGERDPWGRPLDERVVLVLKHWTYAGTGYTTASPESVLAVASASRARAH